MHYDYCITGATSAIGRYFIRRIAQAIPEARLLATGRKNTLVTDGTLDFLNVDFAENSYEELVGQHSFEHLIHLAAATPATTAPNDFASFLRTNVYGPSEFIRAACNRGLRSVFYLSSTAVYDRTRGQKLFEHSPKTTTDYYGLSKLVFEKFIVDCAHQYSIPSLGLRVPVLLTDGVTNNFLSNWKMKLMSDEVITAANVHAPFNAVCPDWAIFETFNEFIKEPGNDAKVTNIHARESGTLMEILQAVGAQSVNIVESVRPAQTIESVSGHNVPSFNAVTEATKFLLG